MIKEQRYEMILEKLSNSEIQSLEKLSLDLNIPMTTLRRDLADLEARGLILKLRGGAKIISNNVVVEDKFENKVEYNIEEKKRLAQKAVKMIKANESIFLDTGSSTFYISKLLDPKLNLTIVTNSIYNVQELAKNGHTNVYLLGGKFTSITGAILGYEAIEALKNYFFDKSFLGVNAVDKNQDIFTTSSEHAQIKVEIIKHSQKAYGMADSSKYNSKSFYKFATADELELIS
ncbi:DeoR/GlpR transcriptional regulator [Mesoplasma syrphidae]|uniref:DeoR/GlpR transcriptional regulator n=1 Tax=Mesoplasma syrphidae TaxID=225999 RepID=A0A2K9C9Q1_9MOLU|nr:DeoR/GlpR family DNA-binding transcription regulator [Mesoplasma syrphidae]AUF83745.1 DeoR/GlpR transcriptional regulator [Mesoplasma syrphidae]